MGCNPNSGASSQTCRIVDANAWYKRTLSTHIYCIESLYLYYKISYNDCFWFCLPLVCRLTTPTTFVTEPDFIYLGILTNKLTRESKFACYPGNCKSVAAGLLLWFIYTTAKATWHLMGSQIMQFTVYLKQ